MHGELISLVLQWSNAALVTRTASGQDNSILLHDNTCAYSFSGLKGVSSFRHTQNSHVFICFLVSDVFGKLVAHQGEIDVEGQLRRC